ncbi:hypothetical protein VTH82DRAFT_491 [Thermothelomyces myriococcoides]
MKYTITLLLLPLVAVAKASNIPSTDSSTSDVVVARDHSSTEPGFVDVPRHDHPGSEHPDHQHNDGESFRACARDHAGEGNGAGAGAGDHDTSECGGEHDGQRGLEKRKGGRFRSGGGTRAGSYYGGAHSSSAGAILDLDFGLLAAAGLVGVGFGAIHW